MITNIRNLYAMTPEIQLSNKPTDIEKCSMIKTIGLNIYLIKKELKYEHMDKTHLISLAMELMNSITRLMALSSKIQHLEFCYKINLFNTNGLFFNLNRLRDIHPMRIETLCLMLLEAGNLLINKKIEQCTLASTPTEWDHSCTLLQTSQLLNFALPVIASGSMIYATYQSLRSLWNHLPNGNEDFFAINPDSLE